VSIRAGEKGSTEYQTGAGGGADYKPLNHPIQSVWLRDVTLFALGKFPERIYFRALE
jgi:hypothetical protein